MKPIETLSDDEFVHLVQQAVAMPDAPASWQRAAVRMWAAPATISSVASSALRLIQAVLSFDSWAQPTQAAGVRASASDTRHLLFNARGRDVDLRISPAAAGGFVLSGQILGPDETGTLELVRCDAEPHDAGSHDAGPATRCSALDEMGEFRIDGVDQGSYRIILHVAAADIALPPIDVGPCGR